MKVLQVGNTDKIGGILGTYLHRHLLRRGVESQLCVWNKKLEDENTWQPFDFSFRSSVAQKFRNLETNMSLQSVLYPFYWPLLFDKKFLSTDIVHYHLIHTSFFSLISLPALSKRKPTIWTLHDPWAMTGHCIYPYNCEKWISGCGDCPRLDTPLPLSKDRTALMWKIKKWAYKNSDIDIIVASKWMLNMAKKSPLLSKFHVHYIPFGIDLNVFRPMDTEKARSAFGIRPGSMVLAFRATSNEFKGLRYIKECLRKLNSKKPICLLTFSEIGLLDEFKDTYQVIELGWVDDEILPTIYNACDIFLMPSTVEAFGVVAMEAMACGKPVIIFDGTSLPEVIFAPKGGIAVPQGDVEALTFAIESLINNPKLRQEIGGSALELARKNYNLDTFMDRIMELYNEVIERRKEGF